MGVEFQAHVKCVECQKLVYVGDAIRVTKHFEWGEEELDFCSHRCHEQWYLNHLRKEGL